ncbi:hypothetical protein CRE_01439 [Caenorhabditis remanei]|uniref:Uncharacterized protein n=1 Tax=Caenorhabditis remanei TaxID=31234 RepID=E3NM13_CAERE|nr:hypothetical protein CRE_01439 [Caenorhabditis remanei]
MTVNITTDTDFVPHPQKTEANTSAPIVAETMQHADVKLSKVLFTGEGSSQVLLLGKGRGRCVALWERDDGIDPFRILSIKNSEVDPNDACKMPENRVCVGYADGSLAVFNTAKEDLTLMSRIPSVHDGSASRAICRNGNGVLSASSNGTLSDVDVETGKARTVFSGQAGIRSICTSFGSNVVTAGDSNGQITIWDLRENNGVYPTCADSLLVSANDGSLIRIDASAAPIAMGSRSQKDVIWLEGELANSLRLDPIRNESIFPISSFDIHSDTVVAASSIGMVSLYQQLPFYPNNTVFGRV